jgi:hypothetical protein
MEPGDAAPKTVTIARMGDSYRGPGHEPGWTVTPDSHDFNIPQPACEDDTDD